MYTRILIKLEEVHAIPAVRLIQMFGYYQTYIYAYYVRTVCFQFLNQCLFTFYYIGF